MTRIMFDSNAFDKMCDNIHRLQNNGDLEFFVTNIQIEEILSIPDTKQATRLSTGKNLCALRPKIVSTPFTFDYVDFSRFSFRPEPMYWKILKDNSANRNDALIAASAIQENCILVTDDTDLLKRMNRISAQVMTFTDFCKQYLQQRGDTP